MTRLGILQREEPLSQQEWGLALEQLRSKLDPYLDSFSLWPLGNTPCLDISRRGFDPGDLHELNQDAASIAGDETLSLQTQGLYSWEGSKVKEDTHDNSRGIGYIWGISQHTPWILACVRYAYHPHLSSREHSPTSFYRATDVVITRSSPAKIVQETGLEYLRLYRFLAQCIQGWVTQRDMLLREAQSLLEETRISQDILMSLPSSRNT